MSNKHNEHEVCANCGFYGAKLIIFKPSINSIAPKPESQFQEPSMKDSILKLALAAGIIVLKQTEIAYFYFCPKCKHVFR